MDIKKFTEGKTGTLVPIKTVGGQNHAFIPNALPAQWKISDALWPKLLEARKTLAHLDGIGETLPDQELLFAPLKTRESITSSRIEGTYATPQELLLFELSPSEPKSEHDNVNTWREVANYSLALSSGINRLQELPFCNRLFKELHKTLMTGVRGQNTIPGEYRKVQVALGSDWRFVPPPPGDVDKCMNDFEQYLNDESDGLDPLIKAYMAHYQFEAIHPFLDGNGRIGRVILSLMTYQGYKLSRPWLYMSSFFEKYKDEYVSNMFRISTEGDWDKWIDFCLTGTIYQTNDAIYRCKQLNALKTNMLSREHSGSIRIERIINSLFSNPVVRVSQLAKKLKVSYPTAQADVDRLVELKILVPLNNSYPKAYYAPEILDIAYAE